MWSYIKNILYKKVKGSLAYSVMIAIGCLMSCAIALRGVKIFYIKVTIMRVRNNFLIEAAHYKHHHKVQHNNEFFTTNKAPRIPKPASEIHSTKIQPHTITLNEYNINSQNNITTKDRNQLLLYNMKKDKNLGPVTIRAQNEKLLYFYKNVLYKTETFDEFHIDMHYVPIDHYYN